jgi:Spy/CpxP family protein refolding chaperone
MLFRMHRVLTAEQRQLLDAYNERRRNERRQRDSGAGDRRQRL